MSGSRNDDHLAYGDYHGQGEEGERGLIGDVGKRLFGRKTPSGQPNDPYASSGQSYGQPGAPGPGQGQQSSGGGSFIFDKLHQAVHNIGNEVKDRVSGQNKPPGTGPAQPQALNTTGNRFDSFAPQRQDNNIKWYVDGCGYMWAVSIALERAKESIWILDWWLSPELYLRRPPMKHEQYRVDRMLQAAAQRGVKVNIIVYKEVSQALTRKFLNPALPDYLHSLLPRHTDPVTKFLTRLGLDFTFSSLEEWERSSPLISPPVTVDSSHTKHHLEDLHPNIAVFRHPDHHPDTQVLTSSFMDSISNLTAAKASQLPGDTLKKIYGVSGGTVLYWAHHEKLCLIDGKTAFMGGLDLCYGRWDTNQHPIADAHPGDLNKIVFPGQDFNNARIMDFQDVEHWENNKLDRLTNSRMGWSDVALCFTGPAVEDLQVHFAQRWNFIYTEKYTSRKDSRYSLLPVPGNAGNNNVPQSNAPPPPPPYQNPGQGGYYAPPPPQSYRGVDEQDQSDRGFGGEQDYEGQEERGIFTHGGQGGFRNKLKGRLEQGVQQLENRYGQQGQYGHSQGGTPQNQNRVGAACQITRSKAKWSHGDNLEHSIQNAYCEVIRDSKHFVYIENQFFITATGDLQKPIKNRIGAAMVERILRAARNGEKYKMIIMIPSVPAFAGDLKSEDALGTRAIMEFQYNSINRGGHSIYEEIARAGFNPMEYIRFYNVRNYDRINASVVMAQVEQQAGVSYEDARKEHDSLYTADNVQPQAQQYQPQGQGYQPQGQGYQPQGQGYQSQEQGYQAPQQNYQPQSEGYQNPADGNQNQGQGYQPYRPSENQNQNQQYPSYKPVYELDSSRDQPRGDIDRSYGADPAPSGQANAYQQYQQAAAQSGDHQGLGSGRWDTVSECYMLGGEDIRKVPWEQGNMDEIDAFVSEELYIHSKLLIADDRIVVCGSANLNDRSQVGDHDSEIAIVIEDSETCDASINGRSTRVSKFATSLRRQIFRKHLGLIGAQVMDRPDDNFEPIGVRNIYDWGSTEDRLVADPLSDEFLNFWNRRAKTNTDAFARVFHPVPFDGVRTWKQYDDYYERFFHGEEGDKQNKKPSRYKWGHVVAEEFPGGVSEVKEVLSTIKGTLVEMPLMFLKDEDIAKEGLGLNAFTEEVYT